MEENEKSNSWYVLSIDSIHGHNFLRSSTRFSRPIEKPVIRISGFNSFFDPQNSRDPDDNVSSGAGNDPFWTKPFHNRLHLDPGQQNWLSITIYNESRKMHFSRIASKIILLPSTEKTAEQLDVVKFIEASDLSLEIVVTAKFEDHPYKIFEVHPQRILSIKGLEGFNISKSWWRFWSNTPNPYIEVSCKKSSEPRLTTAQKNNEANPVWNDPFQNGFYFDPKEDIEFTVFDGGIFGKEIASQKMNFSDVDRNTARDVHFQMMPGICLRVTLEVDSGMDIRLGSELSPDESRFREDRRLIVYNTMKTKFAEKFANMLQSENDVPTIAVLGSGGGFRAAIGYSGAMAGLQRSGIFDMVTYCAGLSGSAWYLSTLYSHPTWPEKSVKEIADTELKASMVSNSWGRSKPGFFGQLLYHFLAGKSYDANSTVTDAFGKMLGDILLRGRADCKLTDQKAKIEKGKSPMPIYSSIHVKNDTSAKTFHEWVEFTPYEIGLPKYKISLAPEKFGNRFFIGRQIGYSMELPLRYLQGIWGSAYSIQLWRLAVWKQDNKTPTIEDIRNAEEALADQSIRLEYGLSTPPVEDISEDRPNMFVRGWISFKRLVKDNMPLMNTIHMRSARVLSFLKDLAIDSPSDTTGAAKVKYAPRDIPLKIDYSCIYERFPTNKEEMYLVDAGIAFNSPYPPVLRKERDVDLILSFDFSARNSNDTDVVFGEILKAESWLDVCHRPFPNIQLELPVIADGNGRTIECYIFENKDEPECPIVMHFVLINNEFKEKKLDSDDRIVERSEEEKKFADFEVFGDPEDTYGTFNMKYDDTAYERLWQLMEFNTVLYKDEIIEMIGKCIENKKNKKKRDTERH